MATEKTEEEEDNSKMVFEVPKLQMVFATIILTIILLLSVSLIGKLLFICIFFEYFELEAILPNLVVTHLLIKPVKLESL